ncbi:MAG: hypothetical protein BYD32DRAFT_457294 [Podila humilis]|nr:MAG: hypothetical protein BYD32DRAFT_457294 [Podila humilis]
MEMATKNRIPSHSHLPSTSHPRKSRPLNEAAINAGQRNMRPTRIQRPMAVGAVAVLSSTLFIAFNPDHGPKSHSRVSSPSTQDDKEYK